MSGTAGTAGTVLLTGANGFVASHIVAGLVQRDYHILATVRSSQRSKEMLQTHPDWKDSITFIYIPDMIAAHAYDEAFTIAKEQGGLDYIIHNASPLNFATKELEKEVIEPAVKGTVGLLEAAHAQAGEKLKRFVLLGSAVSILDSFDDMSEPGKPYTEEDWNPVTTEYAIEHNDAVAAYNASKKLAEQEAWRFMKEENPRFELAVINPDIIIGPIEHFVKGPENVNETNAFAIWNFLNGTYKDIEDLKFPFYHAVDVRDVALAHILALTRSAAANHRHILVAGTISPQIVLNTIHSHFPELKDRVIKGNPEQLMPKGVDPTGWDTRRSREVFGPEMRYIGIEESIVDTVSSLLKLEKGWSG